jgi:hypothetical protein
VFASLLITSCYPPGAARGSHDKINALHVAVSFLRFSSGAQLQPYHVPLSSGEKCVDGISNQEIIIYNFKVKIPSLNPVTTKCCIWQNYNYYIMIPLLPEKVKIMRHIFK